MQCSTIRLSCGSFSSAAPGQELALGDQRRAGDGDDLVLVRLPDVDEEDVVARVEHCLELGGGDGRARRGLAAASSETAPQNVLVVDQLGDRGVLAADRALGSLRTLTVR